MTKINNKTRVGPDGILLFNRSNGLNLLLDEIIPPDNMWDKAPRQVSIALTNACDLRCPACYAPKFPANICSQKLMNWLSELDMAGTLGIGFGGGEPTLHKDFSKLCCNLTNNTGLAVTFTTHGHHIDEILAEKLFRNVHFIRVSMDGIGKTYETLRGRPFPKFLQHLKIIAGIAPFGINYLVNSRTFPEIDEALELATNIGAREFLLLPEQPTRATHGISPATSADLTKWVQNYRGSLPLSVSEKGAAALPTCTALLKENGLSAYAHINASGELMESSYSTEGIKIGSDGVMNSLKMLRQRIGEKL